MNISKYVPVALAVAALAAPAAHASHREGTAYPAKAVAVHQARVGAAIPDIDLRSSYPMFHSLSVVSRQVSPAVVVQESRGFAWREAGFGAMLGALAMTLAAAALVTARRFHARRLAA